MAGHRSRDPRRLEEFALNLAHSLTHSADRFPSKTALVFEGKRWTYAQWNRLANKAAHAFRAAGLKKGDRVAILTYNLPEQVTAFYALMKIGAVPVPLNYRLAANEIKYIVEDCGARMLIFEEAVRALVAGVEVEKLLYIGDKPQGKEVPFERFIEPGAESEPLADVAGSDTAFIMYTSGTSGRPKGVVRSHLAEAMGAMAMTIDLGFRDDDTALINKPLFHVGQLQLQFIPFVQNGATNVMTRGFDVHETLSLVGEERVTVLHGVPTHMVMLVAADLSKYDLRSLRCGFYGGQTLADDVTRKCMALFPERFVNVYGSTEVLMATCCDYRRNPDKLGSVGQAAINMEVRVMRAESPADLCKPGEVGQIIVRGPSLLTEYFGLPERTASSLRDGWFRTGDAGVRDADGFITALGRIDYTIKSGGENIHPSEIENILFKHPGVANAAALGLPSRKWGQAVCAAIVRRDPALTEAMLDEFCFRNPDLAQFKRPRHYFFVDDIPGSATGKVERGELAKRLMARIPGELP